MVGVEGVEREREKKKTQVSGQSLTVCASSLTQNIYTSYVLLEV